MHIIGRGRYAREGYPVAGSIAALAALTNRYLATPLMAPDAFTVTAPTVQNVAAANVTRRASGIFVVMMALPIVLSVADEYQFSATLIPGATASGGTVDQDWRLGIGSAVVLAGGGTPSPMSAYIQQAGAGNLAQTAVLVGLNPTPAPLGSSAILIAGTTIGGAAITPGDIFVSAYELP